MIEKCYKLKDCREEECCRCEGTVHFARNYTKKYKNYR